MRYTRRDVTGEHRPKPSLSRLGRGHSACTVVASVLALILALIACTPASMPTATAPPTASPSSAPTATIHPPTEPPLVTDTPAPTETPPPTATEGPATSPPTSVPPTEPSDTPTPQAIVHTFEANVDIADPGDTITLSWRWSGADSATIYHHFPPGVLGEPHWDVGPSGSLAYTIPPDTRNYETFSLHLYRDGIGQMTADTLQIPLRCPDEWFFSPSPDICPASPATVTDGAEQHFEDGVMVWNRAEGLIYVLFEGEDRQWRACIDRWEEGDPASDPDIEPPLGLYQPIRGFGLVWREEPNVRERLGWAIQPEEGYETALQSTSHYRYRDLYIRALGGGVWKLRPNGSSWERVSTEGG